MALNIKKEETHRLASRLAEATGMTLTDAVTAALRESLERKVREVDVEALLAEVAQIQQLVEDLPDRDTRPADRILGYDDQGLPT